MAAECAVGKEHCMADARAAGQAAGEGWETVWAKQWLRGGAGDVTAVFRAKPMWEG